MYISALVNSQNQLSQARERIADLAEQNNRLNFQFQERHEQRKQIKAEKEKLEAIAKLQQSPAGKIAANFLNALNMAISSEECQHARQNHRKWANNRRV